MKYNIEDLHEQIKLWGTGGIKLKALYLIYFDNQVQFSPYQFGIHLATWDEWAIETGTQSKTILADWVQEAVQFYLDRKEQERLNEELR